MNVFQTTTSPLTIFLKSLQPTQVLLIVVAIIGFIWLIYTVILMYHWFRYSHQSRYAAVVFAVHLFVSSIIGIYAVSGFLP